MTLDSSMLSENPVRKSHLLYDSIDRTHPEEANLESRLMLASFEGDEKMECEY